MRIIGQLPTEESARTFSDYLLTEGIGNEVEPEREHWTIWIHAEDEVDRAKALLARFQADPHEPSLIKQARRARELRKAEAEQRESSRQPVGREQILRRTGPYTLGLCTMVLMLACVAVAVFTNLESHGPALRPLLISESSGGPLLPEVRRGEVWRLITPILVHFGWVHLLFNMLCLMDLGSIVEGRQGRWTLVSLVIVIGIASNVGQYLRTGYNFGGMSGVIYGLLGYIYVKSRFDPGSGLFLHPQTVTIMLAWFFLCLFGVVGGVANTAHGVGLGVGALWGWLASLRWFSK